MLMQSQGNLLEYTTRKPNELDMSDADIQQFRDSLDVLYDLYAGRPASKEVIQIGISAGDIPDRDKTRSLLEFLREEAGKREIEEKLTQEDKDMLFAAGDSSRRRRAKK
ncbi:hypothetical protein DTO271G3_5300 [Paecilomyces variotii]|nr:hypothetical protein DTO271G3_5300 [Paecilomyces variotii]